jgi:hypothetical protein
VHHRAEQRLTRLTYAVVLPTTLQQAALINQKNFARIQVLQAAQAIRAPINPNHTPMGDQEIVEFGGSHHLSR